MRVRTLRTRFACACAAVAGLAIVAVMVLTYVAARSLLTVDTDKTFQALVDGVTDRARQVELTPVAFAAPADPDGVEHRVLAARQVLAQVLGPAGDVQVRDPGRMRLPVTDVESAAAAEQQPGTQTEYATAFDGESYQVVAVSLGGGRGAVQIAQRRTEAVRLLGDLAQLIIVVGGGVFGFAGVLGWWIAGRVTRRLQQLTIAAEEVAASRSLDTLVPSAGRDEVGRLGTAIAAMLAQLAQARDDQRRLVEDAGHELRTPLTSVRTNVAALRRFTELAPDDRAQLLADLDGETRELSALVDEIIALSTDRYRQEPPEPVDLARVAGIVAQRAAGRTGRTVTVTVAPAGSVALVRAAGLERAIGNLVDNAAKFDTSGAPIEIEVGAGRIAVLDRGPGIPAGAEERIFDRFYRALPARSLPGSGLGLAIVRTVAEAHGGTVFAGGRPGGGSVVGFTLSLRSHPS